MTAAELYQASPVKRHRSTKGEVEARRAALCHIIAKMYPMTVRQVFYQASVRGIVEKSEAGYAKVQTDLVHMRRVGFWDDAEDGLRRLFQLPYEWLADNTRWQRKPRTFGSVEQALQETAKLYRKALWTGADAYVEVWLEKDALAGVIYPVSPQNELPPMVAPRS